MNIQPASITELSNNTYFWLLAAEKKVYPSLLEKPPSKTRREVIQQHDDLFGHLHAFLELLPQTEEQQKFAEVENIVADFLQALANDFCNQTLKDKQVGRRGGLRPPVAVETWSFLQTFYLAAGGQAATFIACPDIRNQLNPALLKSADDVAKQILFTWNFINLTLAEATGVDFSDEGETDNEI